MWCARFNDRERKALCELIRSQGDIGPALAGALESLELARWDDLPEAGLPWDEVERAAAEQGIGEADVIWDLAGRNTGRRVRRLKRQRPASGGRKGKGNARPARRRK